MMAFATLAVALGCVGWFAARIWGDAAAAEAGVMRALWTVPAIVGVHLVQVLLSSMGWRVLSGRPQPTEGRFFVLRLVREGINSLLPVAHVGGEVVAVQMLARDGVPAARGAASVVVDVIVELCSQLAFLVAGCCLLGWVVGAGSAWLWVGSIGVAAVTVVGVVVALRLNGLRLLERLVGAIGRRWPGLGAEGLDGLNAEALAIYRDARRLGAAFLLQGAAWGLGTAETWLVLQALGVPVTGVEAFVIESLGAAARSAGFAVPGGVAVQEGGFVLAAAALGIPAGPALSLSLIKRMREGLIGLAGVVCWRFG